MALRNFTDSHGVEWTVWDTVRTTDAPVRETLTEGWLTFEAPATGEKRRLAPVPLYWANAPDDEMERLLAKAKVATAPRGVDAVE